MPWVGVALGIVGMFYENNIKLLTISGVIRINH